MARKPVVDMSAWPSLNLEGNLIAPAMVAAADRREASEQTEADYRIRKGLTIREAAAIVGGVSDADLDAAFQPDVVLGPQALRAKVS